MRWTYQMGRMTPADAAGKKCHEPGCRGGTYGSHDAVYRAEATSPSGQVLRRDLCLAAAPVVAARINHPFPPGPWK